MRAFPVRRLVPACLIAVLTTACGIAVLQAPGASGVSSDSPGGPDVSKRTAGSVERGVVTRVVDGDTAHIRIDGGAVEKVRFIGIDTPESTIRHEPYGKEASAFTKAGLGGKTIWLEYDVELRDRFGRLLAYVWTRAPRDRSAADVRSGMFNATLLIDGYAQIATYPPNVRYVETFRLLEREARQAGKGLWSLPG